MPGHSGKVEVAPGASFGMPVYADTRPVRIGIDGTLGWQRHDRGDANVWITGVLFNMLPEAAADRICAALSAPDVATAAAEALAAIDGHFAVVAHRGNLTLAAVDPVRSYPLLIAERDAISVIDDRADRLVATAGMGREELDWDQALAVALASFTIGPGSLYRSVVQLTPGTARLLTNGRCSHVLHHHRYEPWKPGDIGDGARAIDAAAQVTETVLRKAADSIGDRPVLVPLSAGRDSRLIAAGLQRAGVRDIRCFAYGLPGNHEAETSRLIAERLGLPWTFVPYGVGRLREVQQSDDYAAFVAASDSLTGVHFPQDFAALRALEAQGVVPRDAVIVNGQSGDFITGNHVPATLFEPSDGTPVAHRRQAVIEALIRKHVKQWAFLATPPALDRIASLLSAEIDAVGGMPDDPAGDHGIYEWCEFQDRQAKYVVNGQRTYDYLGYDWRLPLWDRDYLDFWARVPLRHKKRQVLYADMLEATNWGGVWQDVPVNAKTIRPRWMVPVRWACKAAHAPLGRDRWHSFERRAIDYWTGNLCAAAFIPYRRVLTDRRGAYGSISWHVETYLASKGVPLDALVLDR